MNVQTIIWTALPHGADGPLAAGTKLRLSAFVSPRLRSTDPNTAELKLGDFPDWLDWPTTVGAATFEVEFQGGLKLPATKIAAQTLDSNQWKALFNAETLVIPHKFENLTGAVIESFPSVDIHNIIRDVFVKFGTDPAYGGGASLPPREVMGSDPALVDIARPVDPPKRFEPTPIDPHGVFVGDREPEKDIPQPTPPGTTPEPQPPQGCAGCLAGCSGCLAWPIAIVRRLLKAIGLIALLPFTMGIAGGSRSRITRSGAGGAGSAGGGATPMTPKRAAIEAAQHYVKSYVEDTDLAAPTPTAAQLKKTYDFHQMVSTLGDYPILLRNLGLVLELEVTLGATLPPPTGTVKVIPTLPLTTPTTPWSPRTHYSLANGQFVTRAKIGGDLKDGLLRVEDSARFRVLHEDVAGGGIKLQAAATTVVGAEKSQRRAGNDPEEEGLPSLQTAGLSLVRIDQAKELSASFLKSKALNKAVVAVDGSFSTSNAGADPPAEEELFADDVVRGYRVDVFDDKSNRWHPLCRRVGAYDLGAGAIAFDEEDEGFVQLSVTKSAKKEDTLVLRMHESLFTWDGWSMAAPRYGNTIEPDVDAQNKTKVGPPHNDPVTQFPLKVTFTPPPKTLPRLRFGYGYRLRVRCVDLAGNSVFSAFDPDAVFQATPAQVTAAETFRRFEPIAPPMVMLQTVPIEGESLERVVVRSGFNDPPALVRAQRKARHLVPPKTSQLMAERHRKYDLAGGMKSDLATWQAATREAGSLLKRVDPLTGDIKDIPGADPVTFVQTNDSFTLEYLPDPYARGVLLLGLPGMPAPDAIVDSGTDGINKIAFEGTWPDLKPMRLLVTGIEAGAAPKPPHWDAATRVLSVEVPQGETFPVRISSWLKATDLENMAVWKWIADSGAPDLAKLSKLAIDGRNWLVLPYRTLVLVHAVRQPLLIPAIQTVAPTKSKIGDTIAKLTGDVNVDAKSTQKLDLSADWTDPVDDVSKPKFELVPRAMHVGEVRVDDPKKNLVALNNLAHAVGDTKYHRVNYSSVATTRFREYFPTTTPADDLIRPTNAEAKVVKGADVENSVRPDVPKPLYSVPTFEWKRSADGLQVTRRGGGLRVYMERPWFSSGDGELLGITLRPSAIALGSAEAERLKKYTSEWGMDPLWPATPIPPLTQFDFLAPTNSSGAPVPLEELADKVDVVGYTPKYDEERRLWYCDILFEPGKAYFPMVKLALVRYQPMSIDGAEISTVVPTDFIQLVPHREIRYDTANVDTTGKLGIEVRGPAYVNPDQPDSGPRMIARIEERSAAGDATLGWRAVKSQLIPVTSSNPQNMIWKAVLDLPSPRPKPMRVVVLEAEALMSDGRGPVDPLQVFDGTGLPGLDGPIVFDFADRQIEFNVGYRVTFADALEVG